MLTVAEIKKVHFYIGNLSIAVRLIAAADLEEIIFNGEVFNNNLSAGVNNLTTNEDFPIKNKNISVGYWKKVPYIKIKTPLKS